MVLRCGPDHRRPADINVFDRVIDRGIFTRDRLLERVEVYGQQIDGLDAMFFHDRLICAAPAEQPAVDGRVQRLDSPVHDLGKPGLFCNFDNVNTRIAQSTARSTCRENFDA